MLKWITIILGLMLAACIAFYLYSWSNAKEKIAKAEKDLSDYRTKYSAVIQKGDSIETVISGLREKEDGYKHRIDSLQNRVDNLKQENENYQAKVVQLFQPDELVNEMRAAIPELKDAPIGVARVPHPVTGFEIRTFQIPIQTVALFIADHKEAENFKKQIEALGGINKVYSNYVVMQDSIIALKEQKAEAYKQGLDYGLKRYEELMKEYIGALKNPPKIEWPSVTSILASGAAGLAAGLLINK